MSSEVPDGLTPISFQALELVGRVHALRHQELMQAFQADLAHDAILAAAASMEEALYSEATLLGNRLWELSLKQAKARHGVGKFISRFTGVNNLPSVTWNGNYVEPTHTTEPLFTEDGQMVEDIDVKTGWVFAAHIWQHRDGYKPSGVTIYETAFDTESGKPEPRELYDLLLSSKSDPEHNWIIAEPFRKYARQEEERFKQDFPEDYTMFHEELNFKHTSLSKERLSEIFRLVILGKCEYPDELYKEPLGLVVQANKALGTKRA